MTFNAIGKALGISRQRTEQIYATAMHKLRLNPQKVNDLRELAQALDEARKTKNQRGAGQ